MAKKLSLDLAPFYTDPLYSAGQSQLYDFGSNLLSGDIPSYYKAIGETGSKEFEDMLALTTRDTTKAVNENLVRRGISRGGLGASISAKTTADTSTKLRWQDYARALQGKQYLMSAGLNTIGNVTSNALSYGGQKNQYNLSSAELALGVQKANQEAAAKRNAMWSQIATSAIGLIASGGLSGILSGLGAASGTTAGMGAATSGALAGSASASPMASLSSMSAFL
jgi:hypothetical protein